MRSIVLVLTMFCAVAAMFVLPVSSQQPAPPGLMDRVKALEELCQKQANRIAVLETGRVPKTEYDAIVERVKDLETNSLKVGEFSVKTIRRDQKAREGVISVARHDDKPGLTEHWHEVMFGGANGKVIGAVPIFTDALSRANNLRTFDTIWKGNKAGVRASYWGNVPGDAFEVYARILVFYYDK